jgi:hypothetical protein
LVLVQERWNVNCDEVLLCSCLIVVDKGQKLQREGWFVHPSYSVGNELVNIYWAWLAVLICSENYAEVSVITLSI